MNLRRILSLALAFTLAVHSAPAGDTNSVATELQAIVGKIQAKLKAGKDSEKDLSGELKDFDDLLARHKGEKTDELAEVLLMKGVLYLQVLDNTPKGVETIKQLKTDFPETKAGKRADEILVSIERQGEAKKIQASLVPGAKFPEFTEADLAGKPLSVAGTGGKVVLVDFWATWCGPCVAEMPNVIKAYQKYHADGFEVIGISLDEDRERLDGFIKQRSIPWPQFFDGKGWSNKLAIQYGVTGIPATFLLDGEGKIIARDLRGDALDAAIAKALKK